MEVAVLLEAPSKYNLFQLLFQLDLQNKVALSLQKPFLYNFVLSVKIAAQLCDFFTHFKCTENLKQVNQVKQTYFLSKRGNLDLTAPSQITNLEHFGL